LREATPLAIALARAGIACLALASLSCLRVGGLRRGLAHLRSEAVAGGWRVALLGQISFVVTSLLAVGAQQFLPASLNSVLNNLSPLWLAVYAAVLGRARSGPLLVAGSALAAAGVAVVLLGDAILERMAGGVWPAVSGGGPGGAAGSAGIGILLSLAGSVLIAANMVVARRVMPGRDPLALTAIAAGWAAVPLASAVALGAGGGFPAYLSASWETVALLLWLGTMSTAFNFALWNFALAHLPVTRIAHFQYLIAPLGVALAVVFLGERAGAGLLAGLVAIVAGIRLAQGGAEPVR
jgi:drug/metabolite transporter (DMT)-like permease